MRWARGIVVVGVGCLVAACLLPELNDLGGVGPQDASTNEGAVGDSTTADATPKIDGAAGDAGANDGAPDAPKSDAGVACPDASFCDDFDIGSLGAKWTSQSVVDGVLALETGGVSAPNLMRASLVPPVGSVRRAGLKKTFTVAAGMKRIVCAVSVRVVTRPVTSGDDVQLLELYEKGTTVEDVYVKITSTTTFVYEEHAGADGGIVSAGKSLLTTNGGIPTGTWTRITLDLNFATKAASLTILPSGGSTSVINLAALTPTLAVKSYDLNLAEPDDHDVDPSTIHYDDLRCDFTP